MFEVWTKSRQARIYTPIAWFGDEEDAREYAEYLATTNRISEVHYNETAIMPEWDYELEWSHV